MSTPYSRVSRLVIGPPRTTPELRLSLVGAVLGAALGVATGIGLRTGILATDSLAHRFPPPLEPFVLLPLAVGGMAGLRFTTDLVRPSTLTAPQVLRVAIGVLVVGALVLGTFASFQTALLNPAFPAEPLRGLIDGVLFAPVFALMWTIIPGAFVVPLLIPLVLLHAIVVRRLGGSDLRRQ